MRNLKKVLGLVLCLAMMLSIMVVGAGAAFVDQSDIDTKHQDAVDMCASLNIITGFENGKFMPNDSVTREQMAKMICVLDNGGKEPQLSTGNTFSDVAADRWSNKYIESCAARGVVVGIGGGKFSPAGKVTATQAAKMLLVELGYDDDLQQYSGSNWATQVNVDATKKGYYEDLEDIDVNAPLTREHAAQMIWNALQANEVEYSYTLVTNPDGSITSKVNVKDKFENAAGTDGLTLLEDKYGAEIEVGYVVAVDYDADKGEYTYKLVPNANFGGEAVNPEDNDPANGTFKSTNDYTNLFGQKVKVVYKDKKDIFGLCAFESSVLTSGVVIDLPDDAAATDSSIKIDGTSYKLTEDAGSVNFYAFNNDTTIAHLNKDTLANWANNGNVKGYWAYDLIDNTDDGKADAIIVHPALVAQVTNVTTKAIMTDDSYGADASYKFDDHNIYSGAAEDDYVVITPSLETGKLEIVKLDESVSGTLDEINSFDDNDEFATEVTISNASYNTVPVDSYRMGAGALDKDVEGIAYNSYVFYPDTSSDADVSDFAMVIAIDKDNKESGLNKYVQAQLLLTDGSTITVNTVVGKYFNANTQDVYTSAGKDDAASLVNGGSAPYVVDTLVKYDKTNNKSDVYYFEAATGDPANTFGFDKADNNVKYDKSDAMIGSFRINDDAPIYVKDGDDWQVITGATLKTKGDIDAATGNLAYANKNDSTGYNSVVLAVLNAEVTAGNTKYAYVTSSLSNVTVDGDKVAKFTIWDGKEAVTVTSKDKYNSVVNEGLAKGALIQYKSDGGTVLESIKVIVDKADTVKAPDTKWTQFGISAVMSYDSSDKTIVFANDTYNAGIIGATSVTDPYNITDDTVVLYIDRDEKEGFENGVIALANKAANYTAENLLYNANAFYAVDPDNKEDLLLLVVETNKLWNPDTSLVKS